MDISEKSISKPPFDSFTLTVTNSFQLQCLAREQNQYLLHDEWMERLAEWTLEQLVYLDESSACDEQTGDRWYGWALKGKPARKVGSCKRLERWSILFAYTCKGFLWWDIIKGSYDAELFALFLEAHVIPHTNPFPGPRSVIIMDNAWIHHNEVCTSSLSLLRVENPENMRRCRRNSRFSATILARFKSWRRGIHRAQTMVQNM